MTRAEVFATIGWTVAGWLAVVGLIAAVWWVARIVRCPTYRVVSFLADWVRVGDYISVDGPWFYVAAVSRVVGSVTLDAESGQQYVMPGDARVLVSVRA